ncbi:MAG TPA: hypothetical protein VJM34_01655 [Novosphingobium sp.]|nr:hypothetical protein [Novosphingobium sp.]
MHLRLVAVMGLMALSVGTSNAAENQIGESFDKSFRSSCVSAALRKGMPAQIADKSCDCAVSEMNNSFSLTQKLEMLKYPAKREALKPIVQECVKRAI